MDTMRKWPNAEQADGLTTPEELAFHNSCSNGLMTDRPHLNPHDCTSPPSRAETTLVHGDDCPFKSRDEDFWLLTHSTATIMAVEEMLTGVDVLLHFAHQQHIFRMTYQVLNPSPRYFAVLFSLNLIFGHIPHRPERDRISYRSR